MIRAVRFKAVQMKGHTGTGCSRFAVPNDVVADQRCARLSRSPFRTARRVLLWDPPEQRTRANADRSQRRARLGRPREARGPHASGPTSHSDQHRGDLRRAARDVHRHVHQQLGDDHLLGRSEHHADTRVRSHAPSLAMCIGPGAVDPRPARPVGAHESADLPRSPLRLDRSATRTADPAHTAASLPDGLVAAAPSQPEPRKQTQDQPAQR